MKILFHAVAFALMALLGTNQAMAETYTISPGVWSEYQAYLKQIGSTRQGAFAVTEDGLASYYVWCPSLHCLGGMNFRHDAVQSCEREYGRTCVAFANRDDILITYAIGE